MYERASPQPAWAHLGPPSLKFAVKKKNPYMSWYATSHPATL